MTSGFWEIQGFKGSEQGPQTKPQSPEKPTELCESLGDRGLQPVGHLQRWPKAVDSGRAGKLP